MDDKLINTLQDWKSNITEISVHSTYVFGSLIYRNGMLFNPSASDIDMVTIIPSNIKTAIDRFNWLKELKKEKEKLENILIRHLKKDNLNEELISIVPITMLELKYDIHKSKSRTFFRTNEFFDLDKKLKLKGNNLCTFEEMEDELQRQAFQEIQEKRNYFLKNNALGDLRSLDYKGRDPLPKELMRTAAKIRELSLSDFDSGDEFNISFGLDYVKQKLSDNINSHIKYEEIYKYVDSRSGGRSVSDNEVLICENHILIYELLFDSLTNDTKKKQTDQESVAFHPKDTFINFINNTEILKKAHSEKEIVKLSDIFIHPDLESHSDNETNDPILSLKDLISGFNPKDRILIAGEDQSGKTTICRKLCSEFIKKGFIPIYINDAKNNFKGNLKTKLSKQFDLDYTSNIDFDKIERSKIVPILDDFHRANNKEKIVKFLDDFEQSVLIVDDIFSLNLKNEKLIAKYDHFRIKELKPSLRNELIKKWLGLSDKKVAEPNSSEYVDIDKITWVVDSSLGKIIGKGIMPSYPFFILSVVSAYETFEKPLDEEITSQGYCYQTLIYLHLRKQGVKNDEVNIYVNFLSELSNKLFGNKSIELSLDEMVEFLNEYKEKFNLPIPENQLLDNLIGCAILNLDSFNNYSFRYQYIYYYFAGKYLAENLDSEMEEIKSLFSSLHVNENAYIAIFISHHSKRFEIVDLINKVGEDLFSEFAPATLSYEEMSFFDEQIEKLADAIIPETESIPEKERAKLLAKKDDLEESSKNLDSDDDLNDEFYNDLRRSIKTVEVMGRIIKNRSGSLEKKHLLNTFENGLNIYLRIINSFIELIRSESDQEYIVSFIAKTIDRIAKKENKEKTIKKTQKMTNNIFWEQNFRIINGFLRKAIHSLGSDKLTAISTDICEKNGSPAAFIIDNGILMWYKKNLKINTIESRLKQSDFSVTARGILVSEIINHCRYHNVGYKERQRLQSLNISMKATLPRKSVQK